MNKKVKNATITVVDGIKFLSKLEAYVYVQLKTHNIEFKYATDRFTIMYPFEYQNEKVRAMTYKPDFTGDTFVIECKGHPTDAWKVREKLIKRRLSKNYPNLHFYKVGSQKDFNNIIEDLKNRENVKKFTTTCLSSYQNAI